MSRHPREPCSSCPYRKDAPLGHWHREEFEKVLRSEANQFGDVFACHGHLKKKPAQRGMCAGFLHDQLQRGVPNLNVRLRAMEDPELAEVMRTMPELDLYDAPTMCRLNLEAIDGSSYQKSPRADPKDGR